MLSISEVFHSIQGEGLYAGEPMVFVRFQGCNLLLKQCCSYCDTAYAQDSTKGKEMGIQEVVVEVSRLLPYYKSWVCITGGEPLWQEEELHNLVIKLKERGYRITIETNGSIKPPRWYTLVDSWNADIKCPSSGVCGVSKEIWFNTRVSDQIKFVVGNQEDLDFARKVIEKHRADNPVIEVSPVMDGKLFALPDFLRRLGYSITEEQLSEFDLGSTWLQGVAEFAKEMRVHYSLQIHKILYGNRKGV